MAVGTTCNVLPVPVACSTCTSTCTCTAGTVVVVVCSKWYSTLCMYCKKKIVEPLSALHVLYSCAK